MFIILSTEKVNDYYIRRYYIAGGKRKRPRS